MPVGGIPPAGEPVIDMSAARPVSGGLRIAFAGTPDFSVPALEALLKAGHSVVGVLTQPDRPKGRGRQIAASPVKAAALAQGIPVSQPLSLKDEAGRAELLAWRPDVLVVVAYGLILPPAALGIPRMGCINIHASLLPRWRGAAPIQRAILAGDATSGVTIMLMDVGLDTGPMLLRKEVSIEADETGGSLHDRLSVLGGAALIEALEGHAAGTLRAIPQPAEGVTYAAKLEKAEALIDWTRDAFEIERQVRAFNPWPIAETRLDGEQLRIFEARAADSRFGDDRFASSRLIDRRYESDGGAQALQQTVVGHAASAAGPIIEDRPRQPADPGTISAVSDDALVVQCGRGQLALRQLQRPGRRVVPAADLARGLHLTGRRLG
jgi:methionyl-tRNA formyltransferase